MEMRNVLVNCNACGYSDTHEQHKNTSEVVRCPRCGSDSIHMALVASSMPALVEPKL